MAKITQIAIQPLEARDVASSQGGSARGAPARSSQADVFTETKAQVRHKLRADMLQPDRGRTPEALAEDVRHANMVATFIKAKSLKPIVRPDTMEFNNTQNLQLAAHSKLPDTARVAKARMQLRVAEGQAKAGVHYEGQLKIHEALTLLSDADKAQTSQALRLYNPFGAVVGMARDAFYWTSSLITGRTDIHDMDAVEFANRITSEYRTEKSPAFEELEKSGGKMRNVVIVLYDSSHVTNRHYIKATNIMNKYFDARQGDMLLMEGIAYQDGHQLTAEEVSHHCFGVAYANCAVQKEPAGTEKTIRLSQEVNRKMRAAWECMLTTIPAQEAAKATAAHNAHRATVPALQHGDKDLMRFLHAHMGTLTAGSELAKLYAAMQEARQAYTQSQDLGLFERNAAYWNQIESGWMRLNGGNMVATMGLMHGPNARGINMNMGSQPPELTNPVSDYKQAKIPILHVFDRQDEALVF